MYKRQDQSLERILRLLNEEWKENSFDYQVREEKFKEQGIEMLTRYQSNMSDNPPVVVRTEEQFTFDIGPITIRGAIDRIDKTSEGISIWIIKLVKLHHPQSRTFSLQYTQCILNS